MRNGEPSMYIGLSGIRNGYMQMQWNRVQMFLLFNTVALPLVFGTGQPEVVKFVTSLVGVLIHLLLLNAVRRANGWIIFLDKKLIHLEQLDQDDPNGARIFVFSDPDFAAMRNRWFASRRIFALISTALVVIWIHRTIHYSLLLFTN